MRWDFWNNKKDAVEPVDQDSNEALIERMVNDAGGFSISSTAAGTFRMEGGTLTKVRRNVRVLGINMPWKRDFYVPYNKPVQNAPAETQPL